MLVVTVGLRHEIQVHNTEKERIKNGVLASAFFLGDFRAHANLRTFGLGE